MELIAAEKVGISWSSSQMPLLGTSLTFDFVATVWIPLYKYGYETFFKITN